MATTTMSGDNSSVRPWRCRGEEERERTKEGGFDPDGTAERARGVALAERQASRWRRGALGCERALSGLCLMAEEKDDWQEGQVGWASRYSSGPPG